MAKLISKYIVEIYDDGSIQTMRLETDPQPSEQDDTINLKQTSGRIGQTLLILKFFVEAFDSYQDNRKNFQLKLEIREAIEKTASVYGVTIQSVRDKITRQMGMDMHSFRYHMEMFYKTLEAEKDGRPLDRSELELEKLLKEKASLRTTLKDVAMIDLFFENPRRRFLYDTKQTVVTDDE